MNQEEAISILKKRCDGNELAEDALNFIISKLEIMTKNRDHWLHNAAGLQIALDEYDQKHQTSPPPGSMLNPPESFCERYPSLGHPIGEDGMCVGCGKYFGGGPHKYHRGRHRIEDPVVPNATFS